MSFGSTRFICTGFIAELKATCDRFRENPTNLEALSAVEDEQAWWTQFADAPPNLKVIVLLYSTTGRCLALQIYLTSNSHAFPCMHEQEECLYT